ncbi:hypothetical protein [Streptomyces sp. NPDC001492]
MKFLIQNFIANSCAVEPEAGTWAALPHLTPLAAVVVGAAAVDDPSDDPEPLLEPQAVRSKAPETTTEPAARVRSLLFRWGFTLRCSLLVGGRGRRSGGLMTVDQVGVTARTIEELYAPKRTFSVNSLLVMERFAGVEYAARACTGWSGGRQVQARPAHEPVPARSFAATRANWPPALHHPVAYGRQSVIHVSDFLIIPLSGSWY